MNTKNKTPISDDERGIIALEASWEIYGLAVLIDKEMGNCYDADSLAIKGIVRRVKQLNSVIMSAIGDSSEDNASLRKRM